MFCIYYSVRYHSFVICGCHWLFESKWTLRQKEFRAKRKVWDFASTCFSNLITFVNVQGKYSRITSSYLIDPSLTYDDSLKSPYKLVCCLLWAHHTKMYLGTSAAPAFVCSRQNLINMNARMYYACSPHTPWCWCEYFPQPADKDTQHSLYFQIL